jgi:hypothetical protein
MSRGRSREAHLCGEEDLFTMAVQLREVPLEESVELVDSDLHLWEPRAPDGLHVEDARVSDHSVTTICKHTLRREGG